MQYLPLSHFFTIKFHKDLEACGYVSNASMVLTFLFSKLRRKGYISNNETFKILLYSDTSICLRNQYDKIKKNSLKYLNSECR